MDFTTEGESSATFSSKAGVRTIANPEGACKKIRWRFHRPDRAIKVVKPKITGGFPFDVRIAQAGSAKAPLSRPQFARTCERADAAALKWRRTCTADTRYKFAVTKKEFGGPRAPLGLPCSSLRNPARGRLLFDKLSKASPAQKAHEQRQG